MTRDDIITLVYTDPDRRLERFCKSLTAKQTNGDWQELQSIVLERLCTLPCEQVEDMYKKKDGYTDPAIWFWLYNTARTQAFGHRTQYEKVVFNPRHVNKEDEYFDIPTDCAFEQHEDMESRISYEKNIERMKQRFEDNISQQTPLVKLILASYVKGKFNASYVCKTTGVPYSYYLKQLEIIKEALK